MTRKVSHDTLFIRVTALEEKLKKCQSDITSLRDSEAKYRHIVENAQEAIVIIQNMKMVFLNRAAVALSGYPEDVLKSRPLIDLIHPDDRDRVADDFSRRMTKEKAPPHSSFKIIHCDGQVRWVELLAENIVWEGQPATLTFLSDITERRQAQDALQSRELLFRHLFEQHAAVKLIIDPDDGKIIDANIQAEKFYGWPREQLKQMKIQEINTLSPEEIKKEMEKARINQRVQFEFRHRIADGTIRDVEVFSSRIDANGKELLHSIIHDITHRKKMEEEREKLIDDLQRALQEVRKLSGLLPICANCKKIRNDKGYWEQLEEYIGQRSEAEFSHGICPDCLKKLYPELDQKTT